MPRTLAVVFVVFGCATELETPPPQTARCSACNPGESRCGGDDRESICEDLNGDGCHEWSDPRVCASGTCTDGACVAGCAHECAETEALCDQGGRRSCVVGTDDCRFLSGLVPCSDGERCDDGGCVPDDRPCQDACPGDQQSECTADGVRSCGQHDEDRCLEWSVTSVCRPGTACSEGVCMPLCEDLCGEGDRRCAGIAVETCADFDGDGCREFGSAAPCGAELRCDDGACVPEEQACDPLCDQDGDAICDGAALRLCGEFDGDPCLELGPAIACQDFEFCEAGSCVAACEDVCVENAGRCGELGEQTCGHHDADPCLEWGPATRCEDDERCDGDMCVEDEEQCQEECDDDAVRCQANGVQECGDHDDDQCREWGPTEPCEERERCEQGGCREAGPPGVVLINEVFYDPDGRDSANVFIELWGPPNAELAGFRVVGVNGANGEDYAVIPLQGSTDADGFFVIVHPEANDNLRRLATQIHGKADLQNGPDSVQVRWGNQRLDSLGYGRFGRGEVFAGEGDPAADVTDRSLSRDPLHTDSDDNRRDFSERAPSPGQR